MKYFVPTLFLGIGAALLPTLATAQTPKPVPYTWKNVEIVGGGFVTGIVFHPAQKDLPYARTDIGGAYRFDNKTKRWVPLQDWLEKKDWNLYGVESIGLDPRDPKRLYVAAGTYTNNWAGNGAILRSNDQGQTFQRADMPFKLGGNEDGRSIGERLAASGPTVYFGSRHNGLWRSDNYGATWAQVASFPVKSRTDGVGVGIVLIHESGIYASAKTDGGALWRSVDNGKTWQLIAGQPKGLLPHHAIFDRAGTLYVSYGNTPGPNGMTNGAVWKWSVKTGVWTEITPQKPGGFGYAGLTVDANKPGTLYVASMDKWSTGDDIWRSTDGGAHWTALKKTSTRDGSGAPFLFWGRPEVDMGHWMGALALDPFRPGHVLYGTGATIFGSDDADRATTHWTVRAQGLEETATLDLVSPSAGPHLISALGDIGGFRHDDLNVVPKRGQALSPMFNTTNFLDCARHAPNVLVASGNAKIHGAISRDGGASWTLFPTEPAGTRGSGKIALSADGKTILWAPSGAVLSRSTDGGATWTPCVGVTGNVQVAGDGFETNYFYAYDPKTGTVYESGNNGVSFTALSIKVPSSGDTELKGVIDAPNNYWIAAGGNGLWTRSANTQPYKVPSVAAAYHIGFGAPRPGSRYPTVYLNGKIGNTEGIFRSTDVGKSWVQLDDPQHRFGTSNVITGDPRIFGRVYLGTNGRGVLYADPK